MCYVAPCWRKASFTPLCAGRAQSSSNIWSELGLHICPRLNFCPSSRLWRCEDQTSSHLLQPSCSLTSRHQVACSSARRASPCSTPPPSLSGSTARSSCSSTGRLPSSSGACRATPCWSCPEGREHRASPPPSTRLRWAGGPTTISRRVYPSYNRTVACPSAPWRRQGQHTLKATAPQRWPKTLKDKLHCKTLHGKISASEHKGHRHRCVLVWILSTQQSAEVSVSPPERPDGASGVAPGLGAGVCLMFVGSDIELVTVPAQEVSSSAFTLYLSGQETWSRNVMCQESCFVLNGFVLRLKRHSMFFNLYFLLLNFQSIWLTISSVVYFFIHINSAFYKKWKSLEMTCYSFNGTKL